MTRRLIFAIALAAASSAPAFAHLDPAQHGSILAGVSHPLTGLDHILAMVAVGLWAAMLGGRALWRVPTAFVGAMLIGYLAAAAALPLPFVEPMVVASVVVFGLIVAVAMRIPTSAAVALVGIFAFFHGHAHGGEIGQAGLASFGFGFVVVTALLHVTGLAAGIGLKQEYAGRAAARLAGLATALGGLYLIMSA